MDNVLIIASLLLSLNSLAGDVFCKAYFYHRLQPSVPDICIEPGLSVGQCDALTTMVANVLKRADEGYFYVTYSQFYSEKPLMAYYPSCDSLINAFKPSKQKR
jgi:hypothetical protein